jgi:hypothetical protein
MRPTPTPFASRCDLVPQSPFAPHNRSTAASHRRTSRRSPRRAPTCSLRARPSSTVSLARRAPQPHAWDAPRAPSARSPARPPARAPARPRATAGLRLSMLRPPAHHTPPPPPPTHSRGLQGHDRRHARGAGPGALPGQGQDRRLSVWRRVRGRVHGVRSQRATRTLNPVLLLLPRLGRAHSEITSRRQWLHDSELLCSFVHR